MGRVAFNADLQTVSFFCPGCGRPHVLNVDPTLGRPCWTWNGNVNRPTVDPSVGSNLPDRKYHVEGVTVCHSFVVDGRIRFLNDSTHSLAGHVVDLPEVDA